MISSERNEPDPAPARTRLVVLACTLVALVLFLVVGRLLEPDPRGYGTHEQLGMEGCWMVERWATPCPGCGVTTSLVLASRGRVLDSLAAQPFGTLLAGLLVAAVLWSAVAVLRRRDVAADLSRLRPWRWGTVLGLLLLASWAYKIARMRGWL